MPIKYCSTTASQAMKFAAVGVVNTALDLAVFSCLFYIFELGLIFSNSVAFLTAVIQSYLLNKVWTFRSSIENKITMKEFILFSTVQLSALMLSNITIYILSIYLPVLISKLMATVVTFVWGFLVTKRVVFHGKH